MDDCNAIVVQQTDLDEQCTVTLMELLLLTDMYLSVVIIARNKHVLMEHTRISACMCSIVPCFRLHLVSFRQGDVIGGLVSCGVLLLDPFNDRISS